MQDALALHDRILRGAIDGANGYVFATGGDAFAAAFASAADALRAATVAQAGLQGADWGKTGRLKVRMALHTGTAEERDGDYFGPPLNRCARILSVADGDEILVSLASQQLLKGHIPDGAELVDIGQVRLKDLGLSDNVFIYTHPDFTTRTHQDSGDAGRRLRGYELIENIGEGSFGVVYRAKQAGVGREVAIKVVRSEFANNPEFIRRFDSEAQLVARLEHPYIVPLYDYWREPDGAYLVMRWLKGGNLKTSLRTGPWKLEAIAALLRQVGGALALAHRRGVVHRDIKPANILLDDEGNAYLSDFGIAFDISHQAQLDALDDSSSWPAYSSPEQLRREPASPSADIYSLGMVLHEMATGSYPFGDDLPSRLLDRQLEGGLPSAVESTAGLPVELDRIVARATSSQPEERYPDVESLVAAVDGLVSHTRPQVAATVSQRNPYKGLEAFQQMDSGDFFGREALTDQIITTLTERRIVAVVGPSGSGKSSVVKAGVLPALRDSPDWAGWFFSEMVPGTHPFEELEAALLRVAVDAPATLLEQLTGDATGLRRAIKRILPGGDTGLVLVIDQFEELFSLVEDQDVRRDFLAALQAAANDERSRLRIIITLRADFFDQPLLYPEFAEVMKAGLVPVTPLTGDELERAILEPGRRAGVDFEPGLVGEIVSSVADQAGALPLLQYALAELYDRSEGGTLTIAAYDEIGRVAGALGNRAEEVFESLDSPARESARQVFLRLVTLGEGTSDTRRRVLRPDLAMANTDSTTIDLVLDRFGESRLLSFDRDPLSRGATVEVAHEALLREWPRLREWVDASRDDLRLYRRLAAVALDWDEAGRDESFLLSGARLEQIEAWAGTTSIDPTATETSFIEASVARRAVLAQAEEEQRQREAALERRAIRRLRWLAAVLASAAIVAGGLTLFAFNERSKADDQREVALTEQARAEAESERAQAQTRIATARALAAASLANLDIDPERSILLALEGREQTAPIDGTVLPEVEDALHRSLQATRIEDRLDPATTAKYSADGTMLVTAGLDGLVRVLDAATLNEISRTRSAHPDIIQEVDVSPDGTLIATVGQDGTLRIWDLDSGLLLRALDGHGGENVARVAFAPDGEMIATSGFDSAVTVWEVATGEQIARFVVGDTGFSSAGFAWSPDGTRLAASQNVFGTSVVILDVVTGGQILDIPGLDNAVLCSVAFDASGERLAAGNIDGGVAVWDLGPDGLNAVPSLRLEGHNDVACAVGFSPRGDQIATAGADGIVNLWDSQNGRLMFRLGGHTAPIRDVSFSPDGRRLVSSGLDSTGRIWDISPSGSREIDTTDARGAAFAVDYHPDGRGIAFYSDSGVYLWEPRSGREPRLVSLGSLSGGSGSLQFTPDGSQLIAVGGAGTVAIVNWATAEVVRTLGFPSDVRGVSLSPNAERMAIAGADGVGRIVEISTGREVLAIDERDPLTAVAWDPTGTAIALGTTEGRVTIWNANTGDLLDTVTRNSGQIVFALAHSPDGRSLAVATTGGHVNVYDVAGGRDVVTLRGHTGVVVDLAYSSDGRVIASAGTDATVKLWDLESGTELLELAPHREGATGVDFSPDGRQLATSSFDATIRVYALDVAELADLARARLTRDLTAEECRQYIPADACGG